MRSKFEQLLVSVAFLSVFLTAWVVLVGLMFYEPKVNNHRGCFWEDFHRYEVCPNAKETD